MCKKHNQPSLNRKEKVLACPTEKYIGTFQTLITATQILPPGLDLHLHLSALLFSMLLTSQPVPFPVVAPGSLMPVSQCVRVCVCVCFVTLVSDSFAIPWTVTLQVPLSMRFPRQEYWSGLPFPSLQDLLNPGKNVSPALQADSLPLSHQGSPCILIFHVKSNTSFPFLIA